MRMMMSLNLLAAVSRNSSSSRDWWAEINESPEWQDGVFFFLCAAYGLVSAVALIQLIRIQLRVPDYGWTTQKVFHLMNFIVNGVRAVVFGFHAKVFLFRPSVFTLVLLDLPGILFFSTYTLLVLFWAEIYHQARSLPTDKLRTVYILTNCIIYFIQVCIWIYLWIDDDATIEMIGKVFIAVVSFIAALGFLLYGGRLFFMLKRFPIESKGRRKKLHEVGSVTAICCTCFLVRCLMVGLAAFNSEASLEVFRSPNLGSHILYAHRDHPFRTCSLYTGQAPSQKSVRAISPYSLERQIPETMERSSIRYNARDRWALGI